MIIRALNNLTVNAPVTYLANSVGVGTNVFQVRNLSGFSPSWAIQVGQTGEQQSELLVLASGAVSGTLGTTTANSIYPHPADTPIYSIKFDSIVFQRSTTGTTGVATPMTNGTITIQANGSQTIFDDTTGAVGYAYNTYFQNSVTLAQSTTSDWIMSTGFPFYSLGKMRQRVKDKLVSAGYVDGIKVDDTTINDWLNEWLELMTNTAIDVNEGYQMGTMQLSYIPNQELGTITNTDFKQFHNVLFVDASGTYTASKMDSNSFSPNKTFSNTFPYFYMQGDSVVGRKPNDQQGTLICEYYKLNPILAEDTDQIPVNMQGYTKSFIDYAHSQALFRDQKIEEATVKTQEALGMMERFRKEITPRNKTGVTYIDIVEDTGADQELWL